MISIVRLRLLFAFISGSFLNQISATPLDAKSIIPAQSPLLASIPVPDHSTSNVKTTIEIITIDIRPSSDILIHELMKAWEYQYKLKSTWIETHEPIPHCVIREWEGRCRRLKESAEWIVDEYGLSVNPLSVFPNAMEATCELL